MQPFRHLLVPAAADIDALGHVNNTVHVRWLQEVATAHWQAAATPAMREGYIWAVVRHEIDYPRPCHLGEALVAETWGERPRGARFDRVTRITGPGGADDLRCQARTTWVLLDQATLRPRRVPAAIAALFDAG